MPIAGPSCLIRISLEDGPGCCNPESHLHGRGKFRDAWSPGWDDNERKAVRLSSGKLGLKRLVVGLDADSLPAFPCLHVLQRLQYLGTIRSPTPARSTQESSSDNEPHILPHGQAVAACRSLAMLACGPRKDQDHLFA